MPKTEKPTALASPIVLVGSSLGYESNIAVKEEVIIDVEIGILDEATDVIDTDQDSNELAGQNNDLVKLIRCPTCGLNRSCWLWLNRHISINHPYHVYKLLFHNVGERKIQKFIELGRRKCDIFVCSFCEESHSSIAQLSDHMHLKHMNDECVQMAQTGYSGPLPEANNKRKARSGKKSQQNNCPTCKKSFVSCFELRKHVKLSHQLIIYKEFLVVQGEGKILEFIQIGEHGDNVYKCHWCQSEFSVLSKLENHVYLRHVKDLGLYLDEFSIESKRYFENVEAPITSYKCPTCSRCFKSFNFLHRHIRSSHRENIYQFVSHVKGKTIINEAVELGRYKSCSYECMKCLMQFQVRLDLENHINSKHLKNSNNKIPTENKNVCPDITEPACKSLTTASTSKTCQEGDFVRSCPTCKKRFLGWRAMHTHIKTDHPYHIYKHSSHQSGNEIVTNFIEMGIFENNIFTCSICKREFKLHAQLESHFSWEHASFKKTAGKNTFNIRSLNRVQKAKKETKTISNDPNEKGKEKEINICPTCGDYFLCWTVLQTHIERKHPHNLYKLSTHLKGSEKITQFIELGICQNNKFVCTHCNEKFEKRSRLENHVIYKHIHSKTRKYHKYRDRPNVTRTKMPYSKAPSIVEKKFRCHICPNLVEFYSGDFLKAHIFINHSQQHHKDVAINATKLVQCPGVKHASCRKKVVYVNGKFVNIKEEKQDKEPQSSCSMESTSTGNYRDVVIKKENVLSIKEEKE